MTVKDIFSPKQLTRVFILSCLFCVFTLAKMNFDLVPLFNDGAFWYMNLIERAAPYSDPQYLRRVDEILQWPGVFLLHVLPLTQDAVRPVIYVTGFMYLFHPIVSLVACFFILRRQRRMELIFFPLFAFSLATLLTLGSSTGVVPDTLSLFWPLLFLILFREKKFRLTSAIFVVLLMAGLAFAYELGFLLFGFLAGVSLWRIVKERESLDPNEFVFRSVIAVATTGCCFWLLYRIIGPFPGDNLDALHQLGYWKSAPFRIYCLFAVPVFVSWVLGLRYSKFSSVKLSLVFGSLLVVSSLVFISVIWRAQPWQVNFFGCYVSRLFAIPLSGLIAFTAVLVFDKSVEVFRKPRVLEAMLLTLSVPLISACIYYSLADRNWTRAVTRLQKDLAKHPGCGVMTDYEWNYIYNFNGVTDWQLADMTILLQGRDVKSVRFVRRFVDSMDEKDPCSLVKNGLIVEIGGWKRKLSEIPYFEIYSLRSR